MEKMLFSLSGIVLVVFFMISCSHLNYYSDITVSSNEFTTKILITAADHIIENNNMKLSYISFVDDPKNIPYIYAVKKNDRLFIFTFGKDAIIIREDASQKCAEDILKLFLEEFEKLNIPKDKIKIKRYYGRKPFITG
jgi:hypothetical protein